MFWTNSRQPPVGKAGTEQADKLGDLQHSSIDAAFEIFQRSRLAHDVTAESAAVVHT